MDGENSIETQQSHDSESKCSNNIIKYI